MLQRRMFSSQIYNKLSGIIIGHWNKRSDRTNSLLIWMDWMHLSVVRIEWVGTASVGAGVYACVDKQAGWLYMLATGWMDIWAGWLEGWLS